MGFVADLHIHSRFSRATSKELNPVNLHRWAALKGLGVVGTGDFTHPEWNAELQDQLEPAEEGLFQLKTSPRILSKRNCRPSAGNLFASCSP
jgi:PHP family Zn ribbon phosphoesterase